MTNDNERRAAPRDVRQDEAAQPGGGVPYGGAHLTLLQRPTLRGLRSLEILLPRTKQHYRLYSHSNVRCLLRSFTPIMMAKCQSMLL